MRMTKAAPAALLALILIYSCKKEEEREPCLQPTTIQLHVKTMRRADSGLAVLDTLLPFPLLRPLSGQPTQYVYDFGRRPTQALAMSLNQVADSCRWSIQPDSAATSLRDTLTFYYSRQPRFLSNACGYTTFYDLKDYRTTTHAIDSVILQNASVTNDVNVINFRIYY
jgi:hypothetical protein